MGWPLSVFFAAAARSRQKKATFSTPSPWWGVFLGRDLEIRDRPAFDQVLLNDALQVFGSAGMIPDSIGVDHRYRAVRADAEAIGLASVNQGFGTAEFEVVQPVLEELPGRRSLFGSTAFGLGGSGAQEDMPFVGVQIEGFRSRSQKVSHAGS